MVKMILQTIPLDAIQFDPRNPRTDGAEGLEELAASMRSGGVVQPPILIREGKGYRVLVGERRIRAARQVGLQALDCLVRDVLDPLETHRARVVENLHRRALNPIDHAAALRVSWLTANAEALGLRKQAETILAQDRTLVELLPQLEALLFENGFKPNAPAVTWDTVLDDLGVDMTPERRKKLLRVLSIPQDVQAKLQQVDISEAAVRSVGALDEEDQREIAAAILDDPSLASKARRIANAVRNEGYTVDEALAEARGEFSFGDEMEEPETEDAMVFEGDQAVVDAVLAFIEAANQVMSALTMLRNATPGGELDIPEPWLSYFHNARTMMEDELAV